MKKKSERKKNENNHKSSSFIEHVFRGHIGKMVKKEKRELKELLSNKVL